MNRPLSPLGRLDDASLIKTDALIDGVWVASAARFAVDDPATGERLADVANLGAAEADAAIAAAAGGGAGERAQTAQRPGAA
jgi:succinate-semialdehyde dehydrogenase/glutarate-semialdehyde dehydrogenase